MFTNTAVTSAVT